MVNPKAKMVPQAVSALSNGSNTLSNADLRSQISLLRWLRTFGDARWMGDSFKVEI